MNLTHYMVEIHLKISMKVTFLNYLDYAQQTLCDNSDVQIPLSENTGKKKALLM